jgi:acetyl-CoA synthetase/4-hydroxybutyrate---CoA ligase (AMP-forming)
MKSVYKDFMEMQSIEDKGQRHRVAETFFDKLNHTPWPEYFNWEDEIFEGLHCVERGERPALIWADMDTREEKRFTYKECAANANKFLNLLRRNGIEKGENIYQMTPSIPEMWFTTLAALRGGIISIHTPTTMTSRELVFRFTAYPPNVIVADESSADALEQAIKESNSTPKLKVVLGQKPGWVSYSAVEGESAEAEPAKMAADDPAFCFFTSGTEALPKRAVHTNITYPLGHLSTAYIIGIKPGGVHNNLSAPGWAKWAWSNFFSPFDAGATTTGLYNRGAMDYAKYLEYIAKLRVNTWCAPPTAWRRFIRLNLDEITSKFDFSSLQELLSMGEPLNPEIINTIKKYFGIEIRDCYGQTESSCMIGNPPYMAGKIKAGSFGLPSPMHDVRLVDDEGKEIAANGIEGHIAVRLDRWRPAGLFTGYMGEPERDEEAFRGNYYYTGDKAYRDEDGYLWFVGRADDVIKSSDYRIGPFEVESALIEHPAVLETAVAGVPDQERYQLVKAFVVLRQGYEPSAEMAKGLYEHSIKLLPRFKIPRVIEFVSKLPLSTGQKIRRVQLRDEEVERKKRGEPRREHEYLYTDFPELREMGR